MLFMPFNILGIWFRGLLSVAILAGGVYLLARWYDESHVLVQGPRPATRVETPTESDPKERVETIGLRGSMSRSAIPLRCARG